MDIWVSAGLQYDSPRHFEKFSLVTIICHVDQATSKWRTHQRQTPSKHMTEVGWRYMGICTPVTLCDCLFDLHSTTIVSGQSLLWSGSSNGSIYCTLYVTCAVQVAYNPRCKRDDHLRGKCTKLILNMCGPY